VTSIVNPDTRVADVYVFKNESFDDSTYANGNPPFTVLGAASGFISRLRYTGYALNYEQIDSILRAGPSTTLDTNSSDSGGMGIAPPYLADAWWVTYTR
jgi:hypothetical protein